MFLAELDQDRNQTVTREEFDGCFQKWFQTWKSDEAAVLTEEQLRTGLNEILSPFRGGPPGGFGFGPPGGMFPPPGGDDDLE
jgi:hypothetical protein